LSLCDKVAARIRAALEKLSIPVEGDAAV
jgi:hypothetical protein